MVDHFHKYIYQKRGFYYFSRRVPKELYQHHAKQRINGDRHPARCWPDDAPGGSAAHRAGKGGSEIRATLAGQQRVSATAQKK